MPRGIPNKKQQTDAAAEVVGQDRPRKMSSAGPAKESLEPAQIEPVDRPVNKEWCDMMAFNQELVKVVVHDTTDKFAERIPEVWVNGELMRFPRGKEVICKRYFVERLARTKPTTFTQEKRKDSDGNEDYYEIPHTAVRYPFSVIEDLNPMGRDWLRAVLSEA